MLKHVQVRIRFIFICFVVMKDPQNPKGLRIPRSPEIQKPDQELQKQEGLLNECTFGCHQYREGCRPYQEVQATYIGKNTDQHTGKEHKV